MNRALTFYSIGLALGLAISCATPPPSVTVAAMCELAAYSTAKRNVLAQPETREDFQSTADLIDVVLDDWFTAGSPTVYDLRQALTWMHLPELSCSEGSIIITDATVLLEIGTAKPVAVPPELVTTVASSIRAGLVRFLEIGSASSPTRK